MKQRDRCVNIDDHMRSLKESKPRAYRLRARADKQAELHQSLAEVAYALHSSVGPANTTVSAIAAKAGVQRLTVYRHFPDMESIFTACTAHAFEIDPPPNPAAWQGIADPERRLRTALADLYGYQRRNARLLANLYRDAAMPEVAAGLRRRAELLARAANVLMVGWSAKNAAHLMRAAFGHALDFGAWQSLAETQRLTDDEAIEMMVGVVKSVAEPAA